MVSRRCLASVSDILKKTGISYTSMDMGEIDITQPVSEIQLQKLKIGLLNSGFELLQEKKAILVEKIIITVIQMIHYENSLPKTSYSDYISDKLQYDYTYLANTFSEIKGVTIEHFIIMHKTERIKELLEYKDLSLSEIADILHYSSVAHLSNQFKKMTGVTPTEYKRNQYLSPRRNLEDL